MINEGILVTSTSDAMRSEMVRQLSRLGETTPDAWERAVFEALTGHRREDVDWNVEDNHAGYFTWVKSFDLHAEELVEDGFARALERDGKSFVAPVETDPAIDWPLLVGPTR